MTGVQTCALPISPASETSLPLDLRAARLRAEYEVLQLALARSNGTLSVAAKLLGISRPTLYGLMESHGIEVEPGKTADVSTEAEDTKVDTE